MLKHLSSVFVVCMLVVGCTRVVRTPEAAPSEYVNRSAGTDIEVYQMKDNVRCYVYPGYNVSCVQVNG